jgi:hypothetical protein
MMNGYLIQQTGRQDISAVGSHQKRQELDRELPVHPCLPLKEAFNIHVTLLYKKVP